LAPVRLLLSLGLVLSMSGTEIERAQQLARGRESERQQFHRRYLVDLQDATVTQFEVITEFRRLVLVTEEHILRGDWLFSRGTRSAEQALEPFRGRVVVRSTLRFNPLNTYITVPPYVLAAGAPTGASLPALDTRVTPQFSTPFKVRGKTLTSLVGATLEADISTAELGQTSRRVAVMLEGKEVAHTVVDFARLD
jgi:hypothetical protein